MQTAKYCGHCGAKLPEGARFCGMCRAEVSVPGVTEAPQTLDPALRVGEPSVSMNTYPSDDVIEIGRSRTKLFWVLCVSLVFLGLGIWLLSYATVSLIMAIVGVLTLLLAIGGTIAIITMLSNNAPGLRFDSQGFEFIATKLRFRRIAWTEVEDYCIVELFGQKYLSIRLKNPDAFLARLSPILRTLAQANMTEEFGGGPIAITSNALAIDFNALVSLFDRYCRRYGNSMANIMEEISSGDAGEMEVVPQKDLTEEEVRGMEKGNNPVGKSEVSEAYLKAKADERQGNKILFIGGVAALVILVLIGSLLIPGFVRSRDEKTISYNPEFLFLLKNDRLASCELSKNFIRGTLKESNIEGNTTKNIRVVVPITDTLVRELTDAGVPFSFTQNSIWSKKEQRKLIPYNPDFLALIRGGRIASCELPSGTTDPSLIRGELKDIDPDTGLPLPFQVIAPITEDLLMALTDSKVQFCFK